jgi:2',3'-cyclic-nucleotide 2'-phosphodiesterase (5'-nucleotidase family)
MSRWWLPALCAAGVLAAGCGRTRATAPTFTLSVVGTNDLHGGVLEVNGRGGLALLDGYVTNLRAARNDAGGAVLLVDAGDLFQGTLESNLNEGAVVVDAYNAIGYQAAAIGNHEFDYGPVGEATVPRGPDDDPRGALKARLAQSHFPWVSANLIRTGASEVPLPNFAPSTVVTINGVGIGIVGLLTEPAMSFTIAANVSDLATTPMVKALVGEATRLRSRGAAIVIALAHAGARCTRIDDPRDLSSCEPQSEIIELARQIPPGLVDAIVAGHRHDALAHEVNGIPIIESWWRGRAFGRIDLIFDRTTGRVQSHRLFQPQDLCEREVPGKAGCAPPSDANAKPAEYEGRPVVPSARVAAILQPAADAAAALQQRPLNAALSATLDFDTSHESAVGDLEADWMRALVPDADVAILNTGGLRSNLEQGPLTYGKLYELLPFDNQRVNIALTGAQLRAVIEANLRRPGSMIVLSGVHASATCEGGRLAVAIARDSGRPIRDPEVLNVVTSDFLATGGDELFTPVMPVRVVASGDVLREEIARMLSRSGGRWGAERSRLPRRIVYEGTRPLTCAS